MSARFLVFREGTAPEMLTAETIRVRLHAGKLDLDTRVRDLAAGQSGPVQPLRDLLPLISGMAPNRSDPTPSTAPLGTNDVPKPIAPQPPPLPTRAPVTSKVNGTADAPQSRPASKLERLGMVFLALGALGSLYRWVDGTYSSTWEAGYRAGWQAARQDPVKTLPPPSTRRGSGE